MKKECNITRDLLPLYIEEICSEDSREYVDEHLKICAECKSTYEYLKYTELCINATEKKEINAFRKLERYLSGKILINYFLFLVAIVIGVLILLFTTNRFSGTTYYVLMPLTMLSTGFTFNHTPFNKLSTKILNVCLIVQGVMLLYTSVIMFFTMYCLRINTSPFGLPTYKLGPLMSGNFKICITISLIFLIIHLYQAGTKQVKYTVWWNISILCIFLNLTYDSMLYTMDTWERTQNTLKHHTLILFIIAIATSFLLWICGKIKNK